MSNLHLYCVTSSSSFSPSFSFCPSIDLTVHPSQSLPPPPTSRSVHHDRRLHLHGPVPPSGEGGGRWLVRTLLHPGLGLLRLHLLSGRRLRGSAQEERVKRREGKKDGGREGGGHTGRREQEGEKLNREFGPGYQASLFGPRLSLH